MKEKIVPTDQLVKQTVGCDKTSREWAGAGQFEANYSNWRRQTTHRS